ncbi:NACHT domain-containing protein [Culturomica massiliensis]|uniref:NACHT domain-containing protein n=1 Tax=Culturomica massiliensis TaxID=1841857 RepID=UPI002666EFEA|nr:hypothetical protein [Culturomica massiliensis]
MDILSLTLTIIGIAASPVYDTIKNSLSPIDRTYKKALEKWTKNNDIRERTARSKFSHWTLLKDYIISPDRIADKDIKLLLSLWEIELEKDNQARSLILCIIAKEELSINTENNTILKNIRDIQVEEFKGLGEKIEGLINEVKSINTSSPQDFSKVIYESKPDYIPRNVYNCIKEKASIPFLNQSQYESKPLLDYLIEDKIKKILLYSDAQCGKSTELNQLAFLLQKSELYNPVVFTLRNYTPTLPLRNQINDNNVFFGKELGVVLLDGLDEVRDTERSNIIHEIEVLSEEFPHLSFIVSCRTNFENTNNIRDFHKLYLEGLSYEAILKYIDDNSNNPLKLRQEIEHKQLYEFIRSPFYLCSLISYFDKEGKLPKNKTEIYDYIIEESFRVDNRRGQDVFRLASRKSEGLLLLKKIAFYLQCTDKQYFTDAEWFQELGCTNENIELCCKFSIFKRDKENLLTFYHNAFKEFLVAKHLINLPFERLIELICYTGTNKLKPSWYNVVVLLVGLLKSEHSLNSNLINWLIENEQEVLVKCDCHFLSQTKKFEIFKSIFNYYKELGILLPYSFRKPLMTFINGRNTSLFLVNEIRLATEFDANLINALSLSEYANFYLLSEDEQKTNIKLLFQCLNKFKDCEDAGSSLFRPYNNQYFKNPESIRELYTIIKDNRNSEILNPFFSLLVDNELCDKYADWVFGKFQHIHNITKNGCTYIVSKDEIYDVLSHLDKSINIGKALDILVKINYYAFDYKKSLEVKKQLLSKAEKIYIYEPQTINIVVRALKKEDISSYNHNDSIVENVQLYRQFFINLNEDDRIYNKYLAKSKEIFCQLVQSENYRETRLEFKECVKVISTLMTDERLELLLSEQGWKEVNLYSFITWIQESNFVSNNKNWRNKIDCRFAAFKTKRNFQKEKQDAFDILFNYVDFKNEIVKLSEKYKIFSTDWEDCAKKREEGVNESVIDFICDHEEDEKEFVDIQKILEFFDEKIFDDFAYQKVHEYLYEDRYNIIISAKQKEIIKEWVTLKISNVHLSQEAEQLIFLIIKLKLEIDRANLLNLLKYSYITVNFSNATNGENNSCVSFFEYIESKVDKDLLDVKIEHILKIKEDYSLELHKCLCSYITRNRVVQFYKYLIVLLEWDNDKRFRQSFQIELIHRILALNEEGVELIMSAYKSLESETQIYFWEKICQNKELFTAIGRQCILENTEKLNYPEYPNERVLRILLFCGSGEALIQCIEYIKNKPEAFCYHSFSLENYEYDQVDNIFIILELGLKQKYMREPYSITETVLYTLERLALKDIQNRDYILSKLRQIAGSDKKYSYLNRTALNWYEKFYEINSEKISIKQAVKKYQYLFA